MLTEEIKNIDKEITKIKVRLHEMEKNGHDVKEYYKLLDNLNIEFYKLKKEEKKREIEELEREREKILEDIVVNGYYWGYQDDLTYIEYQIQEIERNGE